MFLSSLFFSVKMTPKTDLSAYFKRKATESKGPVAKEQMIIPATENANKTETEMTTDDVEKSAAQKNHYNNIPKHIRIESGRYALDHSTKDTLEKI